MSLPKQCPLCFADSHQQGVVTSHVSGNKPGQSRAFFHCKSCDIRYQYPGLTLQEQAHFYSAEFEAFMANRAGPGGGWLKAEEHILANENTRLRRMAYINPNLPETSTVLEVGCSSGFMLYPLAEEGYICTGIEPSGLFGQFVRSRGLTVFKSLDQLHAILPNLRFDIIMHFFVLEHIIEPLEFLNAQLSLLNPGGKLIFEIPNVADPLRSVYDIPAFERFYWSVAHPWYFSEESLNYLLAQLGQPYEIKLDQRYDLSNHMVWARDGKPGGMGRFTPLLGSNLENLYKEALIESGKCDTLVAIVNKE
jgi:SAM-dependent methyltransferase